jgi:hypothetical protein
MTGDPRHVLGPRSKGVAGQAGQSSAAAKNISGPSSRRSCSKNSAEILGLR